ncbi:MAG: SPOR domain-containing protein [Alphaproteobacteria bacterium]|nr:SPOR domain-containing protein [Alphaproteobacteria bacterium]
MNFFVSRFEDKSDRRRSGSPRRGLYGFLAVFLAFGLFAGVVWIAYQEGTKADGDAVVPIVHAEPEPIKTRPERPGGMDVPFQDKLVYGQLAEQAPEPEAPHLLPPPEEPVALPEAAAAPPKTEILQELESTPAPQAEAPAPPPPPVETAARPPAGGEGVRIQIAAMRSEAQAKAQWVQLQKAHDDLLSGLALHVERADLGAKGVFFRVQAGPLSDAGAAAALCEKLKQRKLGCLVVRP